MWGVRGPLQGPSFIDYFLPLCLLAHCFFLFLFFQLLFAIDYPSLWPADRFERAYARSLAAEMATSFSAVRNYAMNLREHRKFQPELFNERVATDIKRLSGIWEELRSKAIQNKDKKDEGFLFGSFTALDAMYAPIMFRFNSYDLASRVEGEHAQAYMRHMLEFGPMKEWAALAAQETEIIPRDELPL